MEGEGGAVERGGEETPMLGTIKCNTRTPLRLLPNASLRQRPATSPAALTIRFTIRRGAANDYARARALTPREIKNKKNRKEKPRATRARRTRRVSERGAKKHVRDGTTTRTTRRSSRNCRQRRLYASPLSSPSSPSSTRHCRDAAAGNDTPAPPRGRTGECTHSPPLPSRPFLQRRATHRRYVQTVQIMGAHTTFFKGGKV